jgi:hypothetical protein
MHCNPAALGCVILVEFHAIDLRQVPFALYDKGLMPRSQDIGEQRAVGMNIVKG